jgi:hypothetical protein
MAGPLVRKFMRRNAVHCEHGMTMSRGPAMAPAVGFPSRPPRQRRLTMHHIARATLSSGRLGKPISALQCNRERL